MEIRSIDMCNYSVPFDFDGIKFVWVEFLNDKDRCLCVYYFDSEKKIEKKLEKEYGHISHCKILPNDKLFIVRKLDECEILRIDENFSVEKSFRNLGDEIIAIDVYLNYTKPINQENEFENIKILQKEKYTKISDNQQAKKMDLEMNQIDDNQVSEENVSVSILDVDGNVNVYENFNISKKFNMYDLKEISSDHKSKQFFSMGYPYYIKQCYSFFSISTDHGVFIIKKEN